MTISKEDRPYAALPGVTLIGVEVRRCPKCGEEEVVIPRIEELHRVLAHTLIHLPGRLRAGEIRFLRKFLGWSGQDFAKRFGVTAENVSRWENGKKRISATADRLLRLCVAELAPVEDYGIDDFEKIDAETEHPAQYSMRMLKNRGWTAQAA